MDSPLVDEERGRTVEMSGNKGKRRSRSAGIHEVQNVQTVRGKKRSLIVVEGENKKGRRSRSLGNNEVIRTRKQGAHNLINKTTLKSEKCAGCRNRIKFGKISLKCSDCKLSF